MSSSFLFLKLEQNNNNKLGLLFLLFELIPENFFEIVLNPKQVNLILKINSLNINKKNGTRQNNAVT